MTSDEIRKVREAAESSSYLPSACMDYVPIMRNFIFSLVGTDGEDSVNEEWLREEWGFRDDCCWESEDEDIERSLNESGCYRCVEPDGVIIWCNATGLTLGRDGHIETVVEFPISNRYQFRLLAAALGIPKKGE